MKVFIHLMLVAWIAISLYAVYGAFFRDFAKREYDLTKRLFPVFLVWPKSLRAFAMMYKALTVLSLVFSIVAYILIVILPS